MQNGLQIKLQPVFDILDIILFIRWLYVIVNPYLLMRENEFIAKLIYISEIRK